MKIEISFCLQDIPHCISGEFSAEDGTAVIRSAVPRPNGRVRKTCLVANLQEFDALVNEYIARKNRGEFKAAS